VNIRRDGPPRSCPVDGRRRRQSNTLSWICLMSLKEGHHANGAADTSPRWPNFTRKIQAEPRRTHDVGLRRHSWPQPPPQFPSTQRSKRANLELEETDPVPHGADPAGGRSSVRSHCFDQPEPTQHRAHSWDWGLVGHPLLGSDATTATVCGDKRPDRKRRIGASDSTCQV
jgi:hypothetical protein